METIIAILTHNRTELKSKSHPVTKQFFQSALVSSIMANYHAGAVLVTKQILLSVCTH